MSAPAGRSLSLCESIHPCQGSGLAASLVPRSWHERAFQHPDRAFSSQGCLMSLRLASVSTWNGRLRLSRSSLAGAPLRSAALTRGSLRGFWSVSLIDD